MQDQDAWGGKGSGGNKAPKRLTKVKLLDNEPCRRSKRTCQGLWHCSELDPEYLDSYERFGYDFDTTLALFRGTRDLNEREGSTLFGLTAS